MKKSKAQQQADKAFINKIHSINIGGGKTVGDLPCPGCGTPLKEHPHADVDIKVVPIPASFFAGMAGNPANN